MNESIRTYAIEQAGFDDCRFTDPFINPWLSRYREWLKNGYHGEMEYLETHLASKEDPNRLLKGVQSALVLMKNYKNTGHKKLPQSHKIARYAVGEDYHLVVRDKLEQLAQFIVDQHPDTKCYCAVDSRPVAERALALKAGIGFLGKNTMVIKPGQGSYFFIGVIFTTLKLRPDPALDWDCGQCRLCLDACPTQAFPEPYQLDATKCISYQTIEQKTELSDAQMAQSQGWLFGCDICQEVCPYNHEKIPLTDWPQLMPESGVGFDIFETFPAESDQIPRKTPLFRSRKRVLPNWQKAWKKRFPDQQDIR